jgi:hypothetical protein
MNAVLSRNLKIDLLLIFIKAFVSLTVYKEEDVERFNEAFGTGPVKANTSCIAAARQNALRTSGEYLVIVKITLTQKLYSFNTLYAPTSIFRCGVVRWKQGRQKKFNLPKKKKRAAG